jgi:hypothetical protein
MALRHIQLNSNAFTKLWDDRSTSAQPNDLSVFHATAAGASAHVLGSVFVRGHLSKAPATLRSLAISAGEVFAGVPALMAPLSYHKVWEDRNTGGWFGLASYGDISFWNAIPPSSDYVGMLRCVVLEELRHNVDIKRFVCVYA